MKFQPRRFVVEVKRGTSRAAFASPDTVANKFSSAEELLFGQNPRSMDGDAEPVGAAAVRPPRRILESLIVAEPPPEEPTVERPRRGRKPGSKNKPKPVLAAPGATPMPRATSRFVWDGSGEPEDEPAPARPAPSAPTPSRAEPAVPGEAEAFAPSAAARQGRLRDRSTILRRYVLDMEPRPGETGRFEARRFARRR